MKIKRVCEQCGKEFEVFPSRIKRGGGKFCSLKCRYKSPKKQIKRVCEVCGKEFGTYPSKIKKGGGKYCSNKCNGEAKKKRIKRVCEQCGIKFEITPSPFTINSGRGKFCSRKCKNEARKKRVNLICEQCGKKFEVKPSTIRQGGGKFCSKKCYSNWQSEHSCGENSPSWQGGISFEPYCTKFNNEFKEYIRSKFGRVCFLCPKTEEENGEKLSVHHVNYNKNCGCDGDETCQFVPLCRSCNSKVNHNREMWEQKIKKKMRNKLNGWYI